jgi:putative two-component system response regulator
LARSEQPDIILLDIVMPVLDGYAVIELLKMDVRTRDLPVIFLTGIDTVQDEEKGLGLGAADYITKPPNEAILLARIKTQIQLRQANQLLRDQNTGLEAEVRRRMHENEQIQDVTIRALARLAETRDNETGRHVLRTSLYVGTLAKLLQKNPKYTLSLSDRTVDLMARSAPLHDIGKVGIPDLILRKPGPLTPIEWEVMRTHAVLGAHAIEAAEKDAEASLEFLTLAKQIAHWHHEHWDGSGYPDGLKWNEIPLAAKLMAIADVFDALITKRVYKPAFSFEKAKQIIADGRGRQFDPEIVDTFLEHFELFTAIAQQYPEE